MTRLARLPLAGMLVGCLAACAAPAEDSEPGVDDPRPTVDIPALPRTLEPASPVVGEVPDAILADLLADASRRTGVPEDDIRVVRAESVTWSDGSLDCPEPGMMYTQALVDGYHVVLEADASTLDYRVRTSGGFILCEGGRPGG